MATALAVTVGATVFGSGVAFGHRTSPSWSQGSPLKVSPTDAPLPVADAEAFRHLLNDPAVRPADGGVPIVHERTRLGTSEWSVITYRNEAGKSCIAEVVPGEGIGAGCPNWSEFARAGQPFVQIGSRQVPDAPTEWDVVWVWGVAITPTGPRVDIVSADCSVRHAHVDGDGAFLEIFTHSDLAAGRWPYALEVDDASGHRVWSQRLHVDAPPTEAARAAGIHAPTARPACRRIGT